MTFLNPFNAALTRLTFTVASGGTTTDALGNAIPGSAPVTADVVITPLGTNRLALIKESLGSDRTGIPVKIRVSSSTGLFPAAIQRGKTVEATCTYEGKAARVAMMIGGRNGAVAGLRLQASVGQSTEGLLSFVG